MRKIQLVFALAAVFVLGHVSGLLFSRPADEGSTEQTRTEPATASERRVGGVLSSTAEAQGLPVDELDHLLPDERRDIRVFRDVSPSVVNITTVALQRRGFFSLDAYEIPSGSGSGFVWDRQGRVVTNYHVVSQGRRFMVNLGEQDYEAELVGVAQAKDLAVLQIQAPPEVLQPIEVGTSGNLVVGQKVLAIGNPFGLDQTLTVGVVSALGRELKSPSGLPIRDVVQTDAAINPGNSGGPLLDSSGRLVGVNTAIYSPSGASAGIGFAVPVDVVRKLVPELIRYGKPRQPGIGVELVEDRWARRSRIEGVIIQAVRPGGPAEKAGLRGLKRTQYGYELGDVIVGANDRPVRRLEDLYLAFEEVGVGNWVRLTIEREDRRRSVDLQLVVVN